MQAGADCLLGEQDFSAFRAAECQAASPVRDLQQAQWTQEGALIVLQIRANAFLHHMVRNIVGSLVRVGRGEEPPEWIAQVLDSRDR
ncbi:MAG: tRNA pseudouridine(38-40) synthase TruA, partial [bacterium]